MAPVQGWTGAFVFVGRTLLKRPRGDPLLYSVGATRGRSRKTGMNGWRAASLATQFGFAVVGCIGGAVAVGHWLDGRAGTAPAFLLGGIAAGVASSVYLIVALYRLQAGVLERPRQVGTRHRK